jgi:hypothetical protein
MRPLYVVLLVSLVGVGFLTGSVVGFVVSVALALLSLGGTIAVIGAMKMYHNGGMTKSELAGVMRSSTICDWVTFVGGIVCVVWAGIHLLTH